MLWTDAFCAPQRYTYRRWRHRIGRCWCAIAFSRVVWFQLPSIAMVQQATYTRQELCTASNYIGVCCASSINDSQCCGVWVDTNWLLASFYHTWHVLNIPWSKFTYAVELRATETIRSLWIWWREYEALLQKKALYRMQYAVISRTESHEPRIDLLELQ